MNRMERAFALKTARAAIELWAKKRERLKPEKVPKAFLEERGCFVTITEAGELRGCIGYPEPVMPLADALVSAAIGACSDPRFPELEMSELGAIRIEISVLTEPKPIRPDDVKVGRDGLIARRGFCSGLLLPQVATEYGWGREEFLGRACEKAGLPAGAWKEKGTKILAFRAEVFGE